MVLFFRYVKLLGVNFVVSDGSKLTYLLQVKLDDCWQVPFHFLGGGPNPSSLKLSDSGQIPVSSDSNDDVAFDLSSSNVLRETREVPRPCSVKLSLSIRKHRHHSECMKKLHTYIYVYLYIQRISNLDQSKLTS